MVYNIGDVITVESSITLYAKWEEVIAVNLSISNTVSSDYNNDLTEGTEIHLRGTTGSEITNVIVTIGNYIVYNETPTNTTNYNKTLNLNSLSLDGLKSLSFNERYNVVLKIETKNGAQKSSTGVEITNYTVSTDMQLNQLADVVNGGNNLQNKVIVQLADIDVNLGKWAENADGTVTFKNGATQWKVIGSADYDYDSNNLTNIKAFAGTFDGKYNKIEGVYINNREKDEMGLFAINEGTIKNVI